MDILFARKAFTIGIHSFLDTNTFSNRKDSFPFSFLPFVSWTLKMAVSNFECQFSLCHSHIHNLNRALVGMWRSTTRVRVTLFHLEEVIYLCLILIISLRLTNLFYIPKPFSVCLYIEDCHALIKHWAFLLIGFPALLWLSHLYFRTNRWRTGKTVSTAGKTATNLPDSW